ncbi:MAG: methionine adenosyltransferase domain-containing protein [Kiritimatiellae bacterium]|nr:methionine adenosyltransferase domain-containing protein [Kiritimatiellia bacterium]
MKSHIAEYVSPGHPDRLADATVEAIVDLAVSRDTEALVGVECAVHTDHVFIDGRIAAGHGRCAVTHGEIEAIARDVYRAAGYGRRWIPAPEDLKVIQNVCLEPLSDDERAIRDLSDDQNVVSGYACDHPETDFLPPAHFIAGYIGRKVDAWRRTLPEKFGPDFKVLVHLAEKGGGWEWRRLTLSIQHAEGVFQREQHELVTPVIHEALAELEARGVRGIGALPAERFVLNGAGDFIQGGPEGDNGLSGKKLAIDFYGPEIPIGGGAICGKDPHKVDVAGAFRARELALELLKKGAGRRAVTVRLGWTPGDAAPAFREAEATDSLGLSRPIPQTEFPPEDWFSIAAAVADTGLAKMPRRTRVLDGYFSQDYGAEH